MRGRGYKAGARKPDQLGPVPAGFTESRSLSHGRETDRGRVLLALALAKLTGLAASSPYRVAVRALADDIEAYLDEPVPAQSAGPDTVERVAELFARHGVFESFRTPQNAEDGRRELAREVVAAVGPVGRPEDTVLLADVLDQLRNADVYGTVPKGTPWRVAFETAATVLEADMDGHESVGRSCEVTDEMTAAALDTLAGKALFLKPDEMRLALEAALGTTAKGDR